MNQILVDPVRIGWSAQIADAKRPNGRLGGLEHSHRLAKKLKAIERNIHMNEE